MMLYDEYLYPDKVFTLVDGEVKALPGPLSNGQHGPCGLLSNEKYASMHSSTGWLHYFVTYNKDNTQTIEVFWRGPKYEGNEYKGQERGYYKYIAHSWEDRFNEEHLVDITFTDSRGDKSRFEEMYRPYKEACNSYLIPDKRYTPYVPQLGLNYAPFVLDRIEKMTEE